MYKYFPKLNEYSFRKRILRDLATKRIIEKSVYTIVDSEYCKNDLVRIYDASPSKIIPIPLCAPPHIYAYQNLSADETGSIIKKHGLPKSYLFYPAQYWEHKNHFRLIKALFYLKENKGIKIQAVFVGSKKRKGYQEVVNFAIKNGISDQIQFLGYVSDRDIVALYKRATAFIYASYGDYTGIPILEAMALKTPILSSNCFSLPIQVGNAGILFDPYNIFEMAESILKIWDDADLRKRLVSAATDRITKLSPENFSQNWISIINKSLTNK